MKSSSHYDKKVIILDLDLLEIGNYNLDDFLYAKKAINELSANQSLLLLTQNTCKDSQKILDSLGIRSGYLIAESGAVAKNISNKKIILEEFLNKEISLQIAYSCIWRGLNFSINTKENHTHPYIVSDWIIRRYKSDLSRLWEVNRNSLLNIENIKKCIESNQIYNFEIYFWEKDEISRRKRMKEFTELISSVSKINYQVKGSTLYIFSDQIDKFLAVKKICEMINLNFRSDGLYLGVHQYTKNVSSNSYFSALTRQVIDNRLEESDATFIPIETLAKNSISWLDWIYSNLHLWAGEHHSEHLESLLSKAKVSWVTTHDIHAIKTGIAKYLYIDLDTKEIFGGISNSEKILNFILRRNFYNRNLLTVGFWRRHTSVVLKFLEAFSKI
ncbi:hypothetical protein MHC_00120 [Mycoplasma haemocanis str. Illinois]|uniref:Uncharacterized protein n=1 Tax=Mycoplasma haemocanis (strain Illinois) TaxID=1111676 RepID=H6N5X5_MYCHN|nr:HAD hydrolase family protein [Mycoplasma haemocanis]AEW44890.1 hypothetical protein MHC_00120 [Mycoplasma haemocanis str. Illinois]